MWRSTRSKDHSVLCHGADANRNFDFNWMEGGASQVKCSYTYAGPHANSEIETRNEDAFFYANANKLDAFLAFHSYSQLLLIPYGNGVRAPNYDEQFEVAKATADRLFLKHGTIYQVGNSQEILYTTSGTSRDHASGRHGIPFSWTVEMRDTGGEFIC